MGVARLQPAPVGQTGAAGPLGQFCVRDGKRKEVHRNARLPGRAGQYGRQVRLLDARVGDGQAADGDGAAVNEYFAARVGVAQGALGGGGVVEAQRAVEVAVGVETVSGADALRSVEGGLISHIKPAVVNHDISSGVKAVFEPPLKRARNDAVQGVHAREHDARGVGAAHEVLVEAALR